MTASPGRTPRARNTCTCRPTSARIDAAMAVPSMISAGKIHRPRLPDHDYLDLPRILQLRFDTASDFLGQRGHAEIIDLLRPNDDTHLASGLNGEDLFHAAIAARDLLDALEPLHVRLE